jgi:hypothetical protein
LKVAKALEGQELSEDITSVRHGDSQLRELKIFEHISLDGVIQVRGSGEDGDYPYGDWTAPYRTPAGRDVVLAAHGESFDLLLGVVG